MTEALDGLRPGLSPTPTVQAVSSPAPTSWRPRSARASSPTSTPPPTPSCPTSSTSEGLLSKPVEFATNEFVLAVPEGSDIELARRPHGEGREDRDRLGVGADRLLHARVAAKLPPAQEKAILANVRSNEPDVKGIVGKLTQGAADAGFVYVTDVNATDGELKAIELPRALEPDVTYGAGVVEGAKQPEPAADVRRRAGRRRLRRRAAGAPASARRRAERGAALVPGAARRSRWRSALDVPDAADRRDLRRLQPGRADRQPGRAGRARRALAQPAHHRDRRWRSSSSSARRPPTCSPRARSAARRSWSTLVELPLVLPPAVAGIALLAAVGPAGILGGAVEAAGIELALATAGVVVALTFVASPFYVRQAMAAFAAVDRTLLDASRTLGRLRGARRSLRVMIPTAMPGLAAGTALALGPRAGRVRRHAHVRRLLPGHHPDRAARDLRPLLAPSSTPRSRCRRCSSRCRPRSCSR